MDERTFTQYFKAFGDPSRLRILRLLASKTMTVNEIVEALSLSQPTVSRHLGILRQADIVTARRDGQNVHYSLNKSNVKSCCAGFCDCLDIRVRKGRSQKKR